MGLKIKAPKIKIKAPKIVTKAVQAVTKPIETAVNSVGKIATGNVGEGFGDLGQLAARTGLDIATAGNKNQVDALTGGALTSAELAARGNSANAIRTGATLGAAVVGGPGAAMAVNTGFAQGGAQGGIMSFLGASQGGEMGLFSDVSNFLNANPAVAGLVNNQISQLTTKKAKKPVDVVATPAASVVSSGLDVKTMAMIGGGLLAAVVAVALIVKK